MSSMSPEELRAAAAKMTSPDDEDDDRVTSAVDDHDWWAALKTARDATRRLADVIEYVELREWASEHGANHIGSVRVYQTSEETVDHVGRIARRGVS